MSKHFIERVIIFLNQDTIENIITEESVHEMKVVM